MDMMQIRRQMMGVIAGMAKGAKHESGEFLVGYGSASVTLKNTYDRYLLLIEMTEESKEQLIDSGVNGNRTYALMAVYPKLEIGELSENNNAWVSRINPSTSALTTTYTVMNMTSTSFSRGAGTGTTDLLTGYRYEYHVVEI